MTDASVASASSGRSKLSQNSQRSHRSHRSYRSTSSTLEAKLEKINEKSASADGPPTVRSQSQSQRSSASSNLSSTRSLETHNTQRSAASGRSKSSKNAPSNKSKTTSSNEKLGRIPEGLNTSDASSSASSWRSPYRSSVNSADSTSVMSSSDASSSAASSSVSSWSSTSKSSMTSRSSKTSSAPSILNASDSSVASHHTLVSTARGQQAEGVDCIEAGNYAQSIKLFTKAMQAYRLNGGGGKKDNQTQQALATLYAYRSKALYKVGAYDASERDSRNALECERLSRPSVGDHPYSDHQAGMSLHPERGAVLRCKVSCLLGDSLLRRGKSEGLASVFGESISAANEVLEMAEDLAEGERESYIHQLAIMSAKEMKERANEGLSSLAEYDALKTKLETKPPSGSKEYLDLLGRAIEISPAAGWLHNAKVMYLIRRRRWFDVANHCEQVAARVARYDDPGIPTSFMRELDPEFFAEKSEHSKGLPPHLRKLDPKASRDASFRLPKELLPHYIRALRLEERYEHAVLIGSAFAEIGRAEFRKEWDKLDRTVKLKEEGDALFRDTYYDRALALYGECLVVDGEKERSILRQASSWPVAATKANPVGGKLHAVLHSNRAVCFLSMGRHDDAIKESSHAIEIHSMYTKAIVRRARCYAKVGQNEKARADFNRYIALVDGAREYPHPPQHQGSACYFDMPSDVSAQQLSAVRSEMNELGIQPIRSRPVRNVTSEPASSNNFRRCNLCCKKNVKSQVVTLQESEHMANERGIDPPRGKGDRKTVSFSSPSSSPRPRFSQNLVKSRPAFDHPLDPPTAVDKHDVDYYQPSTEPRAGISELP